MQMLWTGSFTNRVLFNASKAYIKQLDKRIEYKGLQPVYALSIVNEIFDKETNSWYHHYKLVHLEYKDKSLEGLQLIFVELPKFRVKNYKEKKLKALWLRYLYELENMPDMVSEDLLSVPEIAEAVELTKSSAFTKAQLEAYDKYWDSIRIEKTFIADAEARGKEEGRIEGKIEGKQEVARFLLHSGKLTIEEISSVTGISLEDLSKLLK